MPAPGNRNSHQIARVTVRKAMTTPSPPHSMRPGSAAHPLHTSSQTNAYRLINRAGDGFADLAVDRYGAVLRGARLQPGRKGLAATSRVAGAGRSSWGRRPSTSSIGRCRAMCWMIAARRSLTPIEPLIGRAVERVDVIENGARFIIRPAEGLNPGLFLDMREVREFVRAQRGGQNGVELFCLHVCVWRGGLAGRRGACAQPGHVAALSGLGTRECGA